VLNSSAEARHRRRAGHALAAAYVAERRYDAAAVAIRNLSGDLSGEKQP
jgi:hypothetical protein